MLVESYIHIHLSQSVSFLEKCSVMHLLSELYSQPGVLPRTVMEKRKLIDLNEMVSADENGGDLRDGPRDDPFLLASLAPRLWPFMRHNITSVRHAAIRTLVCLLLLLTIGCLLFRHMFVIHLFKGISLLRSPFTFILPSSLPKLPVCSSLTYS